MQNNRANNMTNNATVNPAKGAPRPGLSVMVIPWTPFTPDIDGVCVSVAVEDLEWNHVEIELARGLSAAEMAGALRAIARLLETTPDLMTAPETGALMVEKGKPDHTKELVPSQEGWLRADGVLEFPYDLPKK
jgi:hypothetical protein